jgi:hypothetical protein
LACAFDEASAFAKATADKSAEKSGRQWLPRTRLFGFHAVFIFWFN